MGETSIAAEEVQGQGCKALEDNVVRARSVVAGAMMVSDPLISAGGGFFDEGGGAPPVTPVARRVTQAATAATRSLATDRRSRSRTRQRRRTTRSVIAPPATAFGLGAASTPLRATHHGWS